MKRHALLLLIALCLNVSSAFANTDTYYSGRVTASASGSGKVYASTSATTPTDANYAATSFVNNTTAYLQTSAPTRTIHLWAKVDEVDYEREVVPTISWTKTAGDDKLTLNGNSGNHITATETGQTTNGINYTVTATFTAPTPGDNQVADGIYYLYNPALDKFASRGHDWGTALTADDYGLPVRIIMTADGYNKIQFLDFNDPTIYWGDDDLNDPLYWVWSDRGEDVPQRRWAFLPKGDGSYHIRSKYWSDEGQNEQYLYVWTENPEDWNMYRMAANSAEQGWMAESEDQISWQLKTQAERDDIIANRLEAQNIATAAQAGITASSTANLESQLAGMMDFDATPADISFKRTDLAWTFTPTREGSAFTPSTDGTEIFNGAGKFTRTLTDLSPGLYKVTVQGYLRDGGHEAVKATYAKGISTMSTGYIRANGKHVQMKPWYEEATLASNDPDNVGQGNTAFGAGKYLNTLYTYVGNDGQLELEVGNDAYTGDNWLFLGDVTLTNYTTLDEETDNADDLMAVNIGDDVFKIPTSDSYYSTLNTALSEAKGSSSGTTDQKRTAIQNLRSAIADFKANATVKNPGAGQKFTITSTSAGHEWTGKVMTIKGAKGETEVNNVTLGYTDAAGSIYPQALTFTPVGGTRNGFKLSYTSGDGIEMYLCTGTAVGNMVGWSDDQIRVTSNAANALIFQVDPFTTADGVWYLRNTVTGTLLGNNNDSFYTGDVNYELALAEAVKPEVEFKVNATYKFSTLVLPFDAPCPTGVEAYTVDGFSGSNLVLASASSFEANKPYVIYASDGFEDAVEGWGAAFTDETVSNSYLTGSCTTDNVDIPEGSYVLSHKKYNGVEKVGFYRIQAGSTVTLPKNRAYLTIPEDNNVKEAYILNDADDETRISDMLSSKTEVEGIYDVKGVRLSRMQRGVNIIRLSDGTTRRVMVK